MREKLLSLMKNEGLTSSRLAEILEIQPSGVSHILSGRNKPGFDLLQKILRRFPRINPDWLLLDSDKMYRDENSSTISSVSAEPDPVASNDLFGTSSIASALRTDTSMSIPTSVAASRATNTNAPEIARVVIFYEDQTCESFLAKK